MDRDPVPIGKLETRAQHQRPVNAPSGRFTSRTSSQSCSQSRRWSESGFRVKVERRADLRRYPVARKGLSTRRPPKTWPCWRSSVSSVVASASIAVSTIRLSQ